MRRSVVLSFQIAIITAALSLLSACGGSSKTPATSGPGIPSVINLSPTAATVTRGQTLLFSASVVDVNGTAVANKTISFNSSNSAVLQVSTSGLACAGTWDSLTNPIVCTPGPAGTATVTAVSGTLTSSPSTVSVHDKITKVVVSPASPSCVSSGNAMQFTARAFSSDGTDVTSTAGAITWNTDNGNVVSIDQTGSATGATPGAAGVFASVNGVTSTRVTFTTCPILSISLHTTTNQRAFAVDIAGTQQLVADVIDTSGTPVKNAGTYLSFVPINEAVGTIPGSAEVFTGLVAGTTPIVAACAPPNCNVGLTPVYSNAVVATVNGNNTTTVYATSKGGTTLLPIDTGTNKPGTPITLPYSPNSMLISRDGNKVYMGSDNGLMVFDVNSGNVATFTTIVGSLVGISPDGTKLAIFNSVRSLIFILAPSSSSTEQFTSTGILAAGFTPEGTKAYMGGGLPFYIYSVTAAFKPETLPTPAYDFNFLTSGSLGFLAGGAPNSVIARNTCDDTVAATIPISGTAQRIQSLPDGNAMLDVTNTGVDVISVAQTSTNVICPPVTSTSVKSTSLNAGVFAPKQLIITPDGSKAYVITADLATVLNYNIKTGATAKIALAGGATPTSGDTTLDSTQLWVGGSDNNVHLINTATNTDTLQVPAGFKPDFVVVRPH